MYAKGFKKVALKDTKNVLTKANNHIWVKEKNGITTKILPSGTKVIQSDHCKQVLTKNNKFIHKEFAKNGANVCIIDVQAEGLHRVSAEIKGLRANVSSFICDVSDEQKVREVIGKIIKQYGNIDVLVNNAGLWRMWKPQVMNGNREFM